MVKHSLSRFLPKLSCWSIQNLALTAQEFLAIHVGPKRSSEFGNLQGLLQSRVMLPSACGSESHEPSILTVQYSYCSTCSGF